MGGFDIEHMKSDEFQKLDHTIRERLIGSVESSEHPIYNKPNKGVLRRIFGHKSSFIGGNSEQTIKCTDSQVVGCNIVGSRNVITNYSITIQILHSDFMLLQQQQVYNVFLQQLQEFLQNGGEQKIIPVIIDKTER